MTKPIGKPNLGRLVDYLLTYKPHSCPKKAIYTVVNERLTTLCEDFGSKTGLDSLPDSIFSGQHEFQERELLILMLKKIKRDHTESVSMGIEIISLVVVAIKISI